MRRNYTRMSERAYMRSGTKCHECSHRFTVNSGGVCVYCLDARERLGREMDKAAAKHRALAAQGEVRNP